MDEKWIYFVFLDLVILTYCKPGYHNDFKPDHGSKPWGHEDWGHDWQGHDWHGHTTQRAKPKGTTKGTATKAQMPKTKSTTQITTPEPTISEIDVRLGDTISAPSDGLSTMQAETSLANEAGQNLQAISSISQDTTETLDSDTAASQALGTVASVLDGLEADQAETKWHVMIYTRRKAKKYELVCGGSLVKPDLVISAGHCFWSPVWQQLPSNQFAAAAGKIYPGWDDPRDKDAQYADVQNVTLTPMLQPCLQPDLAFVTLVTPFYFTSSVKPVCINFDQDLESQQLRKGNFGTIANSVVFQDGRCRHSRLNWLSLPYIEVEICNDKEVMDTRRAHRICAGEDNNETQCVTNKGNGLVFHQNKIPYLRGVDSLICRKFESHSFINLGAVKINADSAIKELFDSCILEECKEFYTNITDTEKETLAVTSESEIDSEANDATVNTSESESSAANDTNIFNFDLGPEDDVVFSATGIGAEPVPSLDDGAGPRFEWHVGVYSKKWSPYMQICGGSLVKRDVVISAAHCFWEGATGLQPASQFAVAGGKLYRPWNDTQDTDAQHSDVSEIILPVRFRGSATSFQDDIAVLRMSNAFTYAPGVRPVCVDFGSGFDREQLTNGNLGIVAGWGLTEENGVPSQRLNYLELPYVELEECFAASEPSFHKYITSDKICAGTQTGKALCRGDSGGGLVLYSETPYLRGIASTAANNENLCNAFALAAFTHIFAHRAFLTENVPDIEKECALSEVGETADKNRDNVASENAGIVGIGIGDISGAGIVVGSSTEEPAKNKGSNNKDKVESENVGVVGIGIGNLSGAGTVVGPVGVGTGTMVGSIGTGVIAGTGTALWRGTTEAENTTPAYSKLPYNHFVCNCNCKS